jgi:hypothetical protein
MGAARIMLDVAVGTRVDVGIASRVSMGRSVGVDKTVVGEAGIGVEGGVAVGSSAVRLQDVRIETRTKVQSRRFISPPRFHLNHGNRDTQ